MDGWIGVDLDGTLAEYHGWQGVDHIGDPIPAMVSRVKEWIKEGKSVRIFTARAFAPEDDRDRQHEAHRAVKVIQDWCLKHIGTVLPVTCTKDYGMLCLWDDRAVQVIPNAGITISELYGAFNK